MTAPRYTAEQLRELATAHLGPTHTALRQAAETERALGAFRAWLASDEATPFRIVLEEFNRRFGRTP